MHDIVNTFLIYLAVVILWFRRLFLKIKGKFFPKYIMRKKIVKIVRESRLEERMGSLTDLLSIANSGNCDVHFLDSCDVICILPVRYNSMYPISDEDIKILKSIKFNLITEENDTSYIEPFKYDVDMETMERVCVSVVSECGKLILLDD